MNKTLIIAALFAACAISAAAQQGGCVAVVAGSNQKKNSPTESFSAAEVADVDLAVLFTPGMAKQLSGPHTVELRIINPRGNLYESKTIPVSSSKDLVGTDTSVPGYPWPMKVKGLQPAAWRNGNYSAATFRLAVGGTLITRNSMYGRWTAELVVDGERLKCGREAAFDITQ